MDLLVKLVEEFFLTHGFNRTYWVGYSGGLDSHVLLHVIAKLRTAHPIKFRAVYIHHGLSLHASQWAKHCAAVCEKLQIDFTQQHIDAKSSSGESPEEIARERRYQAFVDLIATNDMLLTAHHQDDQAETVLLQLMRGAGPKGLAAMPRHKLFGKGFHGRPLLNISRKELQQYAIEQQLHWIDDESNLNTQLTRNFLRHEVIPLLTSRWPAATAMLSRVAEHCADAQDVLEQWSEQHIQLVRGSVTNTLSVKKILTLDAKFQCQIIRAWLNQQNFPLPSAKKMQHIQQDLLQAATDKLPCISWGNVELRRYQDHIYAMLVLPKHDAKKNFSWQIDQPLNLTHGVLHGNLQKNRGLLRKEMTDVTVKFRQGGEVCQLPGRQCHHELKKLFQTWNVLPWLRERLPLIYHGDELIAIPGYFVAEHYATCDEEAGWKLEWVL